MRAQLTRLLLVPLLGCSAQLSCNRTQPAPVQTAPPPSKTELPPAEPAGLLRPLNEVKGPVELLGSDGGALLLSAWPAEGGKTELDGRRLDAHGTTLGVTKMLRTVPGKLVQVSAATVHMEDQDHTAVAWCSETPKGAQVFGLLWLDDKGEVKGKPVDLGLEDHASCPFSLLPYEDSVLLVRATTKKERRCIGSADRKPDSLINNYLCPTHVVQRVTPNSAMAYIADFQVDSRRKPPAAGATPPPEGFDGPFSAVRTDRSVLFVTNLPDTHMGPAINLILLPGAGEPGFDSPMWHARFDRLLWTSEGVLLTGQTVGRGGKTAKESDGLRATLWQANKFGGDVNDRDDYHNEVWPRITKKEIQCEGRRLRCILSGERKFHAVLEPGSPASSFRLSDAATVCGEGAKYTAAAWTGEALLTWDPEGGLGVHSCDNGTVTLSSAKP